MKNQNYVTILVHNPYMNETYFQQIIGREMLSHIEDELWIGRERYKTLTK
jgi:hypothetical protein